MGKREYRQIGKAAEERFCSLVILGSGGRIEIVPPLADDERRDFELHVKHRFGRALSVQVRCHTKLTGSLLHVKLFRGRIQPVDGAYWFFLAYLDLESVDLGEPMFLIPSHALRSAGRLLREIRVSLDPGSHDRWTPYRVSRSELGRRLLAELRKMPRPRPAGRPAAQSSTTEGVAGQLLVAAAAMLGSDGRVKAGFPLVDDEGRDIEVHPGGRFRTAFAIQVKVSTRLWRNYRSRHMRVSVRILPANLISHDCYWYVFAYVERSLASLNEYLFLVPSKVVHAHLGPPGRGGVRWLQFTANMEPDACDLWTPYRLRPGELGQRLAELMRRVPKGFAEAETLASLREIPGICLLGTETIDR